MFKVQQSFKDIMNRLNEQDNALGNCPVQAWSRIEANETPEIKKEVAQFNKLSHQDDLLESSQFFESFSAKTDKASRWDEFSTEETQKQVKDALKEAGI